MPRCAPAPAPTSKVAFVVLPGGAPVKVGPIPVRVREAVAKPMRVGYPAAMPILIQLVVIQLVVITAIALTVTVRAAVVAAAVVVAVVAAAAVIDWNY